MSLVRKAEEAPLDIAEEREWDHMHSMGRRRYVLRQAALGVGVLGLPIAAGVWSGWWSARSTLSMSSLMMLAAGPAISGGFAATYAWLKWQRYERRAALESTMKPAQHLDRLRQRATRYGIIGASLSSAVVVFEIMAHAAPWITAAIAASAVLGWRGVYTTWRSNRAYLATKGLIK